MKFLLFTVIIISPLYSFSQQAFVSAGGETSGGTGSVSYSIGQVSYSTGDTGLLNEGVQQPFEIFAVSISDPQLRVQFALYPNPTTQELTVEMHDYLDGLTAIVFDSKGMQIERIPLLAKRTQLHANNWSAATYLVKILDSKGHSYEYKVIKH